MDGPLPSDALGAEELARFLVANELDPQLLAFGHWPTDGKPPDQRAYRLKAVLCSLLLREACVGDLQIEDLEGLSAHDAGKCHRGAAADVLAGHTSLLVGDVAQRAVNPPACDLVEYLTAVSHGPDPFQGRPLAGINLDCTAFTQGEAHLLREHNIRPNPRAHKNHVHVQVAITRGQFQPGALPLLNGQGFRSRHELDLVRRQFLHDHLGEFGIPANGRPLLARYDFHFAAQVPKGLAHLHGDEAPAYDGDLPDVPLVQVGLDVQAVGEVSDDEDPFQIPARDVQADGIGTGGHDEIIVGDGLAAGQVDQPVPGVDAFDIGFDSCIDARLLELFRRADDQPLGFLDYITDVIRHRSGGEGDEVSPLDHGHVQRFVASFCLGGAGRSPRPAAYDDDLPAHE